MNNADKLLWLILMKLPKQVLVWYCKRKYGANFIGLFYGIPIVRSSNLEPHNIEYPEHPDCF